MNQYLLDIYTMYQEIIIFLTGAVSKAVLLVLFGYGLAHFLSKGLTKVARHRLTAHQLMLVSRLTFYLILFIFIATAVQKLGIHLGVLLGATGVLTIAIGIASQTSMSNVVSGIFIIGEKPFRIGDIIKVNETQGEVMSIDFLSVKIRTEDHTMVRIPNETLIKSALINHSYYPTRRVDLTLGFSYKENLDVVKSVLFNVAEHNKLCLLEPKPSFSIQNFGDMAVYIQFSVWGKQAHYNKLKNSIQEEVKKAFVEAGIEMAINRRSLFTGDVPGLPLPVRIISDQLQ